MFFRDATFSRDPPMRDIKTAFLRSMLAVVAAVLLAAGSRAADWPQFRGAAGDGNAVGSGYATTWGADDNVKWKAALPQGGNGSPIVSAGHVFVACAEDDEGKGRSLYCFDRKTGQQLWVKTVSLAKEMPTHATNPYCGSTPAADGKRVVVWHASAGLHCYDFAGKLIWQRDLGEFRHEWGYGSSPVIHDGQVLLNSGPGKRAFLASISLETGKSNWETDEPQDGDGEKNADGKTMGSWSTPVVAQVDGKDVAVCAMATRVVGYDLKSGKILWSCGDLSGSRYVVVSASPMIADSVCIAMADLRGPSLAFKMGGLGDITEANQLWLNERNPGVVGTGIVVGKHVYRPNSSPGTLECLDIATGKRAWNKRSASGNYWGSIVQAGGLLYATNQKGTTVVFEPDAKSLKEVSRNSLDETTNSTPAFSDGEIFVRTFENLYCIGAK